MAHHILVPLGAVLALSLLAPLPVRGAAVVHSNDPAQLIESVAQAILNPINTHPDQYRSNSSDLDQLVSAQLMPHFDTSFAAQFVLGPHWRDASPEQRLRFTNGFYQLLLHNCADDLVKFSLDHLEVLPYRGDDTTAYTTVDTVVHRHDGESVNLNFAMRRTKTGWKAYDVAIDGVSYDKSFRDDFGEEIEQKGLNEVIARLESEYGRGTAGT
jgi:phospholipid transport system substrate-binding protein